MLGCFSLLFSMLWIGLLRAKKLRDKPRLLRQFADALVIVERESCVRLSPLSDAFVRAADSVDGSASFFKMLSLGLEQKLPLSEIWQIAVEALIDLTPQERQILLSLSGALGCSDLQLQRSAIETCIAALRQQAEAAQRMAASGIRLSVGVSAVCGSMLVVVLC